jgi:hypothetical protein
MAAFERRYPNLRILDRDERDTTPDAPTEQPVPVMPLGGDPLVGVTARLGCPASTATAL